MKEQINNLDEREVDRTAAIIKSMTPAERQEPTIINGSRRARIAKAPVSTSARSRTWSSGSSKPAR